MKVCDTAEGNHELLLERLLGRFDVDHGFVTNDLDVAAAIEIAKHRALDMLRMIDGSPHEDWIINNPIHTSFMFWRGYQLGLDEAKKLENKKPAVAG